jgi:hypothetical protein
MSLLTFACPACQKVLKSFSPIAAGTKVKCPTCGASFAMTAQDAGRAVAPSENGAPPPPPVAVGRRKCRALLLGATALPVVAALAVGAYFLFSHGGAAGTRPEEDPLAYLPPGTEFVVGADVPALLDDPLLGPALESAVREQAGAGDFLDRCAKETGLAPRDLLGHTLLAGKLDVLDALPGALVPAAAANARPAPVTLILKPSRPFDPARVARAAEGGRPRKAHGKTYYEINVGEMRTLYMPSDRLIVLSVLPASELDAVFASDGRKPSISSDAVALVRGAESHPCWAVVPFEGETRARLDRGALKGPKSLADSLQKGKGIAAWGGPDGDRLRFGADVPCANERGAARVAAEAESAWKEQQLELFVVEIVVGSRFPKTVKAIKELRRSVKFDTEAATARANADVTRQTLTDASEELQKGQQSGNLLGGFPPIMPKLPSAPRKTK